MRRRTRAQLRLCLGKKCRTARELRGPERAGRVQSRELLLQNVWVLARWLCTRRPGKGRHKLIPSLLRFDRFRKLLVRAVERFYPPPLVVSVFVSPQSVIH